VGGGFIPFLRVRDDVRMTLRHALVLVPAAACVLLASACSSDPGPASTAPAGSAASIGPSGPTVSGTDADAVQLVDQTGDGTTVTVGRVGAAEAGWIVVVDPSGAVVGSAAVPAGESRDVVVTLDPPLTATQGITAQLHRDVGDAAFDASTDPYVTGGDGGLVGADARYTVG
jgi:hypothetical protein